MAILASPQHDHAVATFFRIEHLVDQVCGSISTEDILACIRVCRSWHRIFGPHIFRRLTVNFGNNDYPRDLVIANAHRVRSITTPFNGDLYFFDMGVSFPNLRHFCFQSTFWTAFEASVDMEERLQKVFEKSPRLVTLSLSLQFLLRDEFDTEFLNALSRLSCLVRLDISSTFTELPIQRLLDHCPDSVQELSLQLRWEIDWDEIAIPVRSITRKRPLQIRRLAITSVTSESEADPVLAPLLKYSPCLNHFSFRTYESEMLDKVIELLIEHGSRSIERLSFKGEISQRHFLFQLVEVFPWLRMISFGDCALSVADCEYDEDDPYLHNPDYKAHFATLFPSDQLGPLGTGGSVFYGLTVLRMDYNNAFYPEVLCALETCPLLREVYLGANWNQKDLYRGISLQDLAQSEWTCTQLEVLVIPVADSAISFGDWEWFPGILRAAQLARNEIVQYVIQLLDKLRSLPNMKQPWIQWHGEGFRMSLETAQALLVNIWDDDEVASGKPRRIIRKEDIEWLGLEWLPQKNLQERIDLGLMCSLAEEQHPGLKYTSLLNDRDIEMLDVTTKYMGRRDLEEVLQQPGLDAQNLSDEEEEEEEKDYIDPSRRRMIKEEDTFFNAYHTIPRRWPRGELFYFFPKDRPHRRYRVAWRSHCTPFRGPTIWYDDDDDDDGDGDSDDGDNEDYDSGGSDGDDDNE